MSVQLRVGGKYRTRDGEVVEIESDDGPPNWPFIGEENGVAYTASGRSGLDPLIDEYDDLVEEAIDSHLDNLTPQETIPHTYTPPQAIACYVILRDTPDIVTLPSNTYSSVLKCGSLEVLTADEEEKQVALFAPNSWVAYVNKEPVND